MIRTSTQLKAKVKNLSGGDSRKSQTLIRNFVMERFLERIALSDYRDNFILKGGMLVASVVGLDTRATMDIDTTIQSQNLSQDDARKILEDVIAVRIDDGVEFAITKVADIMEEHDYPGVRVMLEASLDRLRQAIKVDISTGDVITPHAVEYSYPLMFEERSIALLSYNIETLLAEKLETIMARAGANTRMRDFYDIHVLGRTERIDDATLKAAFSATSRERGTEGLIPELGDILDNAESDAAMRRLWNNYAKDSFFVEGLQWADVMESARALAAKAL